jgi:hypothetical protein
VTGSTKIRSSAVNGGNVATGASFDLAVRVATKAKPQVAGALGVSIGRAVGVGGWGLAARSM